MGKMTLAGIAPTATLNLATLASNHALSMAGHEGRRWIPVTVAMREHAPLLERSRCRRPGER
ncbi:MAG: hypothetical protein A3G75_04170 [Verrucomicrobia bacterium RIFCSPLOWO2_12_FULL_64_8]|nr:MAG: hypothetical protein A3G75_04170 [Verrucomicrobia bacterium RIFCSPLOWO2_12_FULL_64_8]